LTVCRLPWIELGFELEWYTKFLHASTSLEMTWKDLNMIADRIYALMRAFWVREFSKDWTREMDVPPARWFKEPLTKGSLKGAKLDRAKYDIMLTNYYRKRGWDQRGVPTKATLKKLGLQDVAKKLESRLRLVG